VKSAKALTPRLVRDRAGLVVVDLQERLLPAMHQPERVVGEAVRLLRGAAVLGLPVVATEQYPKGLGRTAPAVAAALAPATPFEKTAFSACGAKGLPAELENKKIKDVILCGIEAHVCVSQTCLDLLDRGLRVFVVTDAVSSRTPENLQVGLERMRDAGAVLVSTEMVLFELLGEAGTEEFKRILELVR